MQDARAGASMAMIDNGMLTRLVFRSVCALFCRWLGACTVFFHHRVTVEPVRPGRRRRHLGWLTWLCGQGDVDLRFVTGCQMFVMLLLQLIEELVSLDDERREFLGCLVRLRSCLSRHVFRLAGILLVLCRTYRSFCSLTPRGLWVSFRRAIRSHCWIIKSAPKIMRTKRSVHHYISLFAQSFCWFQTLEIIKIVDN